MILLKLIKANPSNLELGWVQQLFLSSSLIILTLMLNDVVVLLRINLFIFTHDSDVYVLNVVVFMFYSLLFNLLAVFFTQGILLKCIGKIQIEWSLKMRTNTDAIFSDV